ncbi:acyl-CoA dehydrogenase family protein [Gordonia sp. OPL2]|uniref:acyl-CoA dehydrogenase family protein n=1 Tax=Gordonia sp. OPL2 TaxID=2486274 RepID=UPI0021CC6B60|nr:acyl-CoA dehydrogenase family protein [Gordonia sp. OPL2]ROZ98035.1 acyl-CoA dehydrogenase [Gordonia sp. OPL2]
MTIDPDTRRTRLIEDAYRIADDVLFPAAAEVDRSGEIPTSHWTQLADAGLFGIAAPEEAGGPGLGFEQVVEVLEVIISGCLSTGFTWLQHHGVVISLAGTTNSALRRELYDDAREGRVRAGVAYAGVVPTPPRMRATRTDRGWVFDGYAPFVSGWGIVDVLQVSARDVETDDVIAAIVPIDPCPPDIEVMPLHLGAVDASHTVALKISGLAVADERVVSRVTLDDFFASQNVGVRLNGTLPLGLLRRCTSLLDISGHSDAARAIRERSSHVRSRLDAGMADAAALIEARADAAQLALDATATLIAAEGGRALLRGSTPERLAREALFTLVAASRPQLKDLLVERFSGL